MNNTSLSNTNLNYNVDMVFCVDCTESMDNILNIIKERALVFHNDLTSRMHTKNKNISKLRVRIVAFRDYAAYADELSRGLRGNAPMLVTDFFTLPAEADKLELAVRSLQPVGGNDDPEDGLEALAYSIRSDWDTDPNAKHRHVIVLWSDAPAHEIGYAAKVPGYPKGMAADIRELTSWWGNELTHGFCNQDAKRLVLFTPNEGEWNFIAEQWDKVIHYPSQAGCGLNEYDYETILNCLSNSI